VLIVDEMLIQGRRTEHYLTKGCLLSRLGPEEGLKVAEYFLPIGAHDEDEEKLYHNHLVVVNYLVELDPLPGGLYTLEIVLRIHDLSPVPAVGIPEHATSEGHSVYK
jgi:hypothetical protein